MTICSSAAVSSGRWGGLGSRTAAAHCSRTQQATPCLWQILLVPAATAYRRSRAHSSGVSVLWQRAGAQGRRLRPSHRCDCCGPCSMHHTTACMHAVLIGKRLACRSEAEFAASCCAGQQRHSAAGQRPCRAPALSDKPPRLPARCKAAETVTSAHHLSSISGLQPAQSACAGRILCMQTVPCRFS